MSAPATAQVGKILVVDDEESLRMVLEEALTSAGFVVRTASDGFEAMDRLRDEGFDVVLTDIRMPGKTGLELLAEVRVLAPRTEVIIMTSHASLQSSMEAIKQGAHDYIIKPFPDLGTVKQLVRKAVEKVRLLEEREEFIQEITTGNARLAETNELLARRAATISALLDYSQSISRLAAPADFAAATAAALSTLADGRPAIVYRASAPGSLVLDACSGIPREAVRPATAPPGVVKDAELRSWLADMERRNEFGRLVHTQHPPSASYVSPILVSGGVTGACVVLDSVGSVFPPSIRSVLDKFMHQVRVSAENIATAETLRNLSIRDGLTGLYNHRYFQQRMLEEVARAKRYKHELSVIFVDIDRFKQFNDTHGHPRGDELLRRVAVLVRGSGRVSDVNVRGGLEVVGKHAASERSESNPPAPSSRESDVVARYGGEEFVVILVETAFDGAMIRGERLRAAVEAAEFASDEAGGTPHRITVSVGIAALRPEHRTAQNLVAEADRAMYIAKRIGRNRVCSLQDEAKLKSAEEGG